MTTVMLAWELGGGLGHVTRAAGLARALAQRGIRVVIALADLADCDRVEWPDGAILVAAPRPLRQPKDLWNASSFGELIYASGYHDVHQVTGLVTAWSNLMAMSSTDILVADHAPLALLSAKVCGIPTTRIGSGFFAPPPGAMTPIYRNWEPVDVPRAQAAERHVMQVFNLVSQAAGLGQFASLPDALAPELELILSGPELDCYEQARPPGSVVYLGNEYLSTRSSPPQWRSGAQSTRPRIVAYLKGAYASISPVLDILADQFETVAFVSGLSVEQRKRLSTEYLVLSDEPIDLGQAAVEGDVLLCHAGAGTAPWFLAAGKPVLMLPYSAEQMVNAQQIERTGAGRILLAESVTKELANALSGIARDINVRKAALKTAQSWSDREDALLLAAASISASFARRQMS